MDWMEETPLGTFKDITELQEQVRTAIVAFFDVLESLALALGQDKIAVYKACLTMSNHAIRNTPRSESLWNFELSLEENWNAFIASEDLGITPDRVSNVQRQRLDSTARPDHDRNNDTDILENVTQEAHDRGSPIPFRLTAKSKFGRYSQFCSIQRKHRMETEEGRVKLAEIKDKFEAYCQDSFRQPLKNRQFLKRHTTTIQKNLENLESYGLACNLWTLDAEHYEKGLPPLYDAWCSEYGEEYFKKLERAGVGFDMWEEHVKAMKSQEVNMRIPVDRMIRTRYKRKHRPDNPEESNDKKRTKKDAILADARAGLRTVIKTAIQLKLARGERFGNAHLIQPPIRPEVPGFSDRSQEPRYRKVELRTLQTLRKDLDLYLRPHKLALFFRPRQGCPLRREHLIEANYYLGHAGGVEYAKQILQALEDGDILVQQTNPWPDLLDAQCPSFVDEFGSASSNA